jgi:hypothetical protein
MIYFARQHDCEACALKPKCCPNVPARKIARSIHEAARDKARAIAKTEAYAVSRRERKKVEMLFAHLKRILRLDRLRLRGPSGAPRYRLSRKCVLVTPMGLRNVSSRWGQLRRSALIPRQSRLADSQFMVAYLWRRDSASRARRSGCARPRSPQARWSRSSPTMRSIRSRLNVVFPAGRWPSQRARAFSDDLERALAAI